MATPVDTARMKSVLLLPSLASPAKNPTNLHRADPSVVKTPPSATKNIPDPRGLAGGHLDRTA